MNPPPDATDGGSAVKAIVYIPLARFSYRITLKRAVVVTIILPVALLFWMILFDAQRGVLSMLGWSALIGIPITLLIIGIIHMRRAEHIHLDPAADPLTRVFAALDARLPFAYWNRAYWTWDELAELCAAVDMSPPKTVCDACVRKRLEVIERPEAMLEPEPILTSIPMKAQTVVLMVVFYLIVVLLLIFAGQLVGAVICAAIGLVVVASLPQARDFFRNARWDEGNIVVGLGSLHDKTGRRWTIDDAVMLVQTAKGAPPLLVTFVGKVGHLLLTFTDERDPDFVKLWQRWNHPHPRPELRVE